MCMTWSKHLVISYYLAQGTLWSRLRESKFYQVWYGCDQGGRDLANEGQPK